MGLFGKIKRAVKSAVSKVKNTITNIGENIRDTALDIGGNIRDAAFDIGGNIRDAAFDVGGHIWDAKKKAQEVGGKVGDAVKTAGNVLLSLFKGPGEEEEDGGGGGEEDKYVDQGTAVGGTNAQQYAGIDNTGDKLANAAKESQSASDDLLAKLLSDNRAKKKTQPRTRSYIQYRKKRGWKN